jgi:hypothetical protein
VIDVEELKTMLLNTERKFRDEAKKEPESSASLFTIGKAEGIALARSYVETMAKW